MTEPIARRRNVASKIGTSEALEFLDRCRWLTVSRKACSVTVRYTRDGIVRAAVRRKRRESFEAMLVRCAVKAMAATPQTPTDRDAEIAAELGIAW